MKFLLYSFFIFTVSFQMGFSCTIFNMTDDEVTLVGNNEDWRERESYIKIIPAEKGKYGRVFFGFGEDCRYPFGGINDQGLFYDIASLTPRNDIKLDPAKETIDNEIYVKLMETCATVEASIDLLEQYNVNGFKRHDYNSVHLPFFRLAVHWL